LRHDIARKNITRPINPVTPHISKDDDRKASETGLRIRRQWAFGDLILRLILDGPSGLEKGDTAIMGKESHEPREDQS
jgi:hypothetical protein